MQAKQIIQPAFMPSRRRFIQGLAMGGVAIGVNLLRPSRSWALTSPDQPVVRAASQFALDIGEMPVNYTGAMHTATVINGSLPGPLLRWKEGTSVTLRVTNRLRVPTSIHWHGIVLPFQMDGVPGIAFDGIAPGETFVYHFAVRQAGTYWYHSHSGFQEQTGVFGPLVIEPAGPQRHRVDRDYVVMLNDWSDEDPEHIFGKLKKQSSYYNFNQPTLPDFLHELKEQGIKQAWARRKMWNRMRMSPTDLADVTGHTYTYLMNGVTPAGNWTGIFKPGEKVRLRFINGSATTIFDVRIPGLKMTVIAADGQDVAPVAVDEFRMSVAETYDVIVQPEAASAYTVFAQAMDRSGYARGTLAPRIGMQAPVPALDPRVWLGMQDMMGMMDHAEDRHDTPMSEGSMSGVSDAHDSDMAMDQVHHARSEYSASVDMHVAMPRTNLDDPGVGLRQNGRRVLTYADLRSLDGPLDLREPEREIELHLTGNMQRFMWSFDGQKLSEAKPLHFKYGERLRIVLVNDTMMNHPIHLHGMFSDLEDADGEFLIRKHTINVQPAQKISYRVSADNPGQWAYHCHLLYHMEAGMFRKVVVS